MNREEMERAFRIHKKSIIIDALEVAGSFAGEVEYFDKLINAGVTAVNFSVCRISNTPLDAIKRIGIWHEFFAKHGDKVLLATTGRDIERAKRERKVAVIMGTQYAHVIGDDLSLLPIYKKLGLKVIQLTYDRQNLLGEGAGERTDRGLSLFGIKVVEEMNWLGMLIDVSHCKDQVTLDAIKFSKHPIVASHANPRSLVSTYAKNKTDEQIKALAKKGGVIGLNSWTPGAQVRKGLRPDIEDLLTMADYVVKLVGVDHVGIGLDVTPFYTLQEYEAWSKQHLDSDLIPTGGYFERTIFTNKDGVDDPTNLSQFTMGLVARGYSDPDIEKILGLNFLRVIKEVWEE